MRWRRSKQANDQPRRGRLRHQAGRRARRRRDATPGPPITVEVTAEDGVSGETYTVTVTREAPASDATLSALALSRITLDPAFAAETSAYAATVDYAVDETAVTPTTSHGGAGYVIKLGGVLDADGTLPLAQGDNVITVEVTAEDGVSGETYTVTVTREAPASDATLSALALSRITLDPAFAAETSAYAATVDYAVDETAVTPTTSHGGAGYVIKLGGVLDADGTLPLAQGDNIITVEVTAEDGVSDETYTVTVTREAPASDATLSALALSRITLDPAFAAETSAYAATVDYAVEKVKVKPTTSHGGAGYVIKLGGVLDADGTLPLAQGGQRRDLYVITREAPASDATLSALALSRITLDPAFAAETSAYAATVDYAVEKVKVKPTTSHGGAGYVIKLGGVLDADGTLPLAQGDNIITVEVTAEDGVSGETYTVTVTREAPASDATLSALALSRITLDPAFAAETSAYAATVDYAVDETAVTPTTSHGGAGYVIKLGGVLDTDGSLPLRAITSSRSRSPPRMGSETYTVTVTREAPASDATLSALALSRITLDPAFAAETSAYAATVDYAVEKVKVKPTTSHGGAGYVIKLGGVLDADGTLPLAQGDNVITVEVTAEDGVSDETYTVTVTREAPASDATLSALALSRITLDPAFAAETSAYAATVDYAVEKVKVKPTTSHGGAGYVIKLGGVLDADGTLPLAQGDNVITVEVTAEDGVSGETYTVTVTREETAARSIDSFSAPDDVWLWVGQATSGLSSSYTDNQGTGHTATVNWGDGSAAVSLGPVAGGTFNLPSHTYWESGVYTVTVVVTNSEGDSSSASFVARVGADVALGAAVTSSGLTGNTFEVVDDRGDTSVSVAGSWSVEVDLGDAFRVGRVRVAPPTGGTLAGFKVEGRVSTTGTWVELGRVAGAGGGTITTASAGGTLARYVRATPLAALADGATNAIATIEVSGLTQVALADISPSFAGTLAETGFNTRYGTWTVTGGMLTGYGAESDDPTRLGTVYTDLCSPTECDLDHEALTQARVRVLLELPQANPHNASTSLGIGLEEGQGRRRGALAVIMPWRTSLTSNGANAQGGLNMFMYCGPPSSSVGPARLRSEGVNLDCSSRADEVVDHTGQDYDFDLTGGAEYYVELEYRNLKLWARVWKKGEARPVLPQAGVRFTPEHFGDQSFSRNEDYVLNPTRLVLRPWGFTQASPVKIKEVQVTELVKGPKLGLDRGGSRSNGPTHHGRYAPVGRYVVDLPNYATDSAAGLLPVPVLSGSDARLVNVYDKAWELLYTRMKAPTTTNLVRTYVDEAFDTSHIYQWDVAAMMWFVKYMHRSFEGVGTFDNFYAAQQDDGGIARRLRESWQPGSWNTADGEVNPPLFVEAELQAFRLTGDVDRIRRILPALREYIDWVSIVRWSQASTHQLWWNDGGGSGLDNTPRPYSRGSDGGKVWGDPDITAQLAHAYLGLGDLYELIGNDDQATLMRAYGAAIRTRLDEYMWKDFTGNSKNLGQWFFVNRAGNPAPTSGGYRDEPQVAGLWAMILGLDASDPDTADRKTRLRNILFDTEYYYTDMPLGTLPKSHSQFVANGGYAKGGLYPPTTYIGIKGAEKVLGFANGQLLAKRYLDGIADVFQYSNTIWEMYAPTRQVLTEITGTRGKTWSGISSVHNNGRATCTVSGSRFSCDILKTGYSIADLQRDQGNGPYIAPSRRYDNSSLVKPDFVGWGALGPIALLIENIIGIQANAPEREIVWYITRTDRHGIENLWLGDGLGKFSLIAAAQTDINQPISITAASSGATTSETSIRLRVVGRKSELRANFRCDPGSGGPVVYVQL